MVRWFFRLRYRISRLFTKRKTEGTTWHYAPFKDYHGLGYNVCELYRFPDGAGWTGPICAMGDESIEDLIRDLETMIMDLEKCKIDGICVVATEEDGEGFVEGLDE